MGTCPVAMGVQVQPWGLERLNEKYFELLRKYGNEAFPRS
jgi:hypothetical protein